jgi:hypothetical protein
MPDMALATKPAPPVTPKLTPDEKRLLDDPLGMNIYVNALLHRRLKLAATNSGRPLKELVEELLWPTVGGKPRSE